MHCGDLSARKSKKEEIKVNAWLIHFAPQQKLTILYSNYTPIKINFKSLFLDIKRVTGRLSCSHQTFSRIFICKSVAYAT